MALKTIAMALSMAGAAVAGQYGSLHGYWGQNGDSTERLRDFCNTGIESIAVSFLNVSPEKGPGGYPGTNFASHCASQTYNNTDGVPTQLLSNCQLIKEDIPYCQSKGVKILLALGGAVGAGDITVSNDGNAVAFANFLHNAFGPINPNLSVPRPFDLPGQPAAVDGFDFDIEIKVGMLPYVKMVETLRALNPKYIITAAPECPTSDAQFKNKDLIQKAAFDRLFIQFYNNPVCDARSGSITLDQWEKVIKNSDKNQNAQLYIGLPAGPTAAGPNTGGAYISPPDLKKVICNNVKAPHFGGISLWDLSFASANVDATGESYYQNTLDFLEHGCDPVSSTTTTTVTSTSIISVSTTSAVTTTTTTTTTTSATTTTSFSNSTLTGSSTTISSTTLPTTTASGTGVTSIPGGGVTSSSFNWNRTTTAVTTSAVSYTTSTVRTTQVYTVTSCPASVTDCPNGPHVVTKTIDLYTTVCPVGTQTHKPTTPVIATTTPAPWTTSIVYTTTTYTITSCPPEVTNCPVGHVTTATVPWYTTICPASATPTGPTESEAPSTIYTTVGVPASSYTPVGATTVQTQTRPTAPWSGGNSTVVAPTGAAPTGGAPPASGVAPPAGAPSAPASQCPGGPNCPGQTVPVLPPPPPAAPTVPVQGSASALAVGLGSLVAIVAVQVLAL